jgi:hypothetical protein
MSLKDYMIGSIGNSRERVKRVTGSERWKDKPEKDHNGNY